MIVNELASAIYNDVVAGLVGVVSNPTISLEQLEQDVVDERLTLLKKYIVKNLISKKDLYTAITCIPVDCADINKCCAVRDDGTKEVSNEAGSRIPHFEIPQLLNDFGDDAIQFIGSTNREIQFKVYTDKSYLMHKYKMVGKDKPYVFIDTTPNANNMYDGWIFNAPLLERITVVGIFKDLRQVEEFSCCQQESRNMSFLDSEIKQSLTEKKLKYYRVNYVPPQPNNQIPR